ncbi:facilitated trehalose transporter Tret1-like [Aphomia sociella]
MYSKLSPVLRQYIIVFAASLSVLSTGLSLGWGSPVLVKLMKMGNGTEMLLSRPITEDEGSWLVSIEILIGIFAAFIVSPLAAIIGCRQCLILSCVPNITAGFIFVFTDQFWLLLVARGLCGVSLSLTLSLIPVYSTEIAAKEFRGSLCSILPIVCSSGCVTMLIVGPFLSYPVLNVTYTCITIVGSIPVLFIPDSPRFLYTKGKIEESMNLLIILRGSEILARSEIDEYASIEKEKDMKIDRKFYNNSQFLKALFITFVISVLCQCSGYNSVSYYLQTVLESTETTVMPEIASAVVGITQLTAGFLTGCMADKIGRKMILSVTFFGIALGLIGLGAFFKVKEFYEISGIMNFVPIISIIVVIYSFIAGPASIVYTLVAELFDGPTKVIGTSIANLVNNVFMFLSIKYCGAMIVYLGPAWNYFMFSIISVLGSIFVILFVPETMGKTNAEIQERLGRRMFGRSVSPS